MINYGPDYGKLCVIIDVIDQNRVICHHLYFVALLIEPF